MRALSGWLMLLLLLAPAMAQGEPTTLEALLARGNSRFDENDLAGAQADAAAALQLSPDAFDALLLMGRSLGKSRREAEAVPYLERALAQKPEDFKALQAMAVASFETGQAERGAALLDKAIKLYPDKPSLYYNRGYFAYRGKERLAPEEIEAILDDFQIAQELDPNDPSAWGISGWVKWRYTTEPAGALADLGRAIEIKPEAIDYRNRALVYLDLKQNDNAIADLKKALELGGDPELMKDIRDLLATLE